MNQCYKRNRSFPLFLLIVFIFLGSSLLQVSAVTLENLQEVGDFALQYNLTYQEAILSASSALLEAEADPWWESAKLSANSGYTYASGSGAWNHTLNASVDICDNTTFSASIDQNAESAFSVSYEPLKHSIELEQAVLTAKAKKLEEDYLSISLPISAKKALLDFVSANRELSTQLDVVELCKTMYEDTNESFALGAATLDDLQEALLDLMNAQSSLVALQKQQMLAESSLLSIFNYYSDSLELPELTIADVETELSLLQNSIDPEMITPEDSPSVASAQLALDLARLSYNDMRIFDPDISLSGNIGYANGFSAKGTIMVSVGFNDYLQVELQALAEQKTLKEKQLLQAIQDEVLALSQHKKAIESTHATTEAIRFQLAQAEGLLTEAEFLRQMGTYSEVELTDVQLSVKKARDSLFSALKQEYSAWCDLLL